MGLPACGRGNHVLLARLSGNTHHTCPATANRLEYLRARDPSLGPHVVVVLLQVACGAVYPGPGYTQAPGKPGSRDKSVYAGVPLQSDTRPVYTPV